MMLGMKMTKHVRGTFLNQSNYIERLYKHVILLLIIAYDFYPTEIESDFSSKRIC